MFSGARCLLWIRDHVVHYVRYGRRRPIALTYSNHRCGSWSCNRLGGGTSGSSGVVCCTECVAVDQRRVRSRRKAKATQRYSHNHMASNTIFLEFEPPARELRYQLRPFPRWSTDAVWRCRKLRACRLIRVKESDRHARLHVEQASVRYCCLRQEPLRRPGSPASGKSPRPRWI